MGIINGVIYSRGTTTGINTVKSYNSLGSKNSVSINAGTTNLYLNGVESVNLLNTNALGVATGSWIDVSGKSSFDAYYFIDGTGGGAAYTLQYRPNSTYNGYMVIASYTGVSSSTQVQSFEVLNGQYRSINTSGAGINAMPKLLFQYDNIYRVD